MHTLHNHAQHVNYITASLDMVLIHIFSLIIELSPVTTLVAVEAHKCS